ncbi:MULTISPECIES: hypothetical protein [Rhodococcus]|uniref:hypothetical protein n=1 Tax=Rhodococcus TaxID=1827 RepID=UPI000A6EC975|nr:MULTISPECIES: hypothetical protein [Rhodococcus]MCW3471279.1 hypothetical protein [Rhodococcus pyridinivorans]
MGTTLHAPHPWPAITAALRRPGPRRVAIAYLDHTAPDLLPLRSEGQLIVDTARAAVRAHATSPPPSPTSSTPACRCCRLRTCTPA